MNTERNVNIIDLTEAERNEALESYRIIKPFIEDNIPLVKVAEESSKSYRTLLRWVDKYRKYGLSG